METVDFKWRVWHILNNIICCSHYCIFLNSVWDTAREKPIYLKWNLLPWKHVLKLKIALNNENKFTKDFPFFLIFWVNKPVISKRITISWYKIKISVQ